MSTIASGEDDVSQGIVEANPTDHIMDTWTVTRLIDWAAGKDGSKQTRMRLKDELCSVAAELAGSNPSPVERMLAETAATAWFAYRLHEATYASGVTADGSMTLAQSEHAQRRLDRAHRRLLSTLKALAHVRRLALPSVQINLAGRQQIAQLNGGAHECAAPG